MNFRPLVVALGIALTACSESPPVSTGADAPSQVESSRLSMGSTLRLTAWTRDPGATQVAFNEVFTEFDRLEKLMSTWVPDSDVQRVNRAAGRAPVRVSADVRAVLGAAKRTSEWTGGKFDVTFGALSGLWKFDHDQDNGVPDTRGGAAAIAADRLPRNPD